MFASQVAVAVNAFAIGKIQIHPKVGIVNNFLNSVVILQVMDDHFLVELNLSNLYIVAALI